MIGWRTKYPYVLLTVSSGILASKLAYLCLLTTLRLKNISQVYMSTLKETVSSKLMLRPGIKVHPKVQIFIAKLGTR
jgi:hypothetical protein